MKDRFRSYNRGFLGTTSQVSSRATVKIITSIESFSPQMGKTQSSKPSQERWEHHNLVINFPVDMGKRVSADSLCLRKICLSLRLDGDRILSWILMDILRVWLLESCLSWSEAKLAAWRASYIMELLSEVIRWSRSVKFLLIMDSHTLAKTLWSLEPQASILTVMSSAGRFSTKD